MESTHAGVVSDTRGGAPTTWIPPEAVTALQVRGTASGGRGRENLGAAHWKVLFLVKSSLRARSPFMHLDFSQFFEPPSQRLDLLRTEQSHKNIKEKDDR